MHRVFATRRIPQEGLAILEGKCHLKIWEEDVPPPQEVLLEEAAKSEGLLCLLTDEVDREVLRAGKNLKVVANYAVGYDNIDIEEARNRGIVVTNTPGVLTDATADLAFSLLLAGARNLIPADGYTRAGRWQSWGPRLFLGQEVWGKTLGIVGMGRIGRAVARRARGFDMNILYYNRSKHKDIEEELGVQKRELEDLLRDSDFVSIHLPLTEETQNLIGAEELSLMKPTAVLINTARGEIVDQKALVEVLQDKKIFAAGLDVFAKEPIDPQDPLLSLDNVVVLPHIGSASYAARQKMAIMACSDLLAVLEGREPENPVNFSGLQE